MRAVAVGDKLSGYRVEEIRGRAAVVRCLTCGRIDQLLVQSILNNARRGVTRCILCRDEPHRQQRQRWKEQGMKKRAEQ